MKKVKLFMNLVIIVMAITLMSDTQVFASQKQQKIITKKISTSKIKKIKKSDKKGDVVEDALSETGYAWLLGIKDEDGIDDTIQYLQVTADGKEERTIDLNSIVKKSIKPSSDDVIRFYHLTCINDTFYVTGAIGKADENIIDYHAKNVTHFYISTKDGKKCSVNKVDYPIMPYGISEQYMLAPELSLDIEDRRRFCDEGWRMYFVNGKYVAVADVIRESFSDIKCTKSLGYRYFTSVDLKTWKPVKMTIFSKLTKGYHELVVKPSGASEKYMIFEEVLDTWNQRTRHPSNLYTYTDDFKNYKKLTSLNKNITSGEVFEVGSKRTLAHISDNGKVSVLKNIKYESAEYGGYGDLHGTCKSFSIYYAKGTNNFKKLFTYNDGFYYYSTMWGKQSLFCFFSPYENAKKNLVYIADLKKGTCEKYTTSLSAEKVKADKDDLKTKAEWEYWIYDGRFLLMSKDNGRTMYKINTNKKGINSIGFAGKNLVIISDKGDYYIPISELKKAVK